MARAELTTVIVTFPWSGTPEEEKHAFMDEFARLVGWHLNRKKGKEGAPPSYQLRWEGSDDRAKFRFDVVGLHEQMDIRQVVHDIAVDAKRRGVPVEFEFVRL